MPNELSNALVSKVVLEFEMINDLGPGFVPSDLRTPRELSQKSCQNMVRLRCFSTELVECDTPTTPKLSFEVLLDDEALMPFDKTVKRD